MEAAELATYIGLDMVDGCRPYPKPACIALLDRDMVCRFETWEFDEQAAGLFPGQIAAPGFVLAIDGPQGLAGLHDSKMRECERSGGVAGKTPYSFPSVGSPYAGVITSSVRLYAALWQSGSFRLHGLPEKEVNQANLVEVYPGKSWQMLARPRRIRLKKKQTVEGRMQRRRLLEELGLRLRPAHLPCEEHDMWDAAMAAYTAYSFASGAFTQQGVPPTWDEDGKVLREGFIVYPDPEP